MAKVTAKLVCELARELKDVSEKDHFGSDAFVSNKRIFVTVWHDRNEVNFKFNLDQQKHFLSMDGEAFVEIDNAWGRQGWTKLQLEFADEKLVEQGLRAAWTNVQSGKHAKGLTSKRLAQAKRSVQKKKVQKGLPKKRARS